METSAPPHSCPPPVHNSRQAYQILRKAGVKEDNIITMMFDDIAHNPMNPHPNQIFNAPGGPNVYEGVKIVSGLGVSWESSWDRGAGLLWLSRSRACTPCRNCLQGRSKGMLRPGPRWRDREGAVHGGKGGGRGPCSLAWVFAGTQMLEPRLGEVVQVAPSSQAQLSPALPGRCVGGTLERF